MTRSSRLVRALCAAALVLFAAAPLFAADTHRRAVAHPVPTTVTISGTVTDATTGLPLAGATVTSGQMSVITDDKGHYSLTCLLGTDATASRAGYVSVKKPVSGTTIDFALPQTPSVTVKLTNGQTVVLDFVTTKFGFVELLQYASGPALTLCKTGTPDWQPDKSEFQRIIGPAHSVSNSACCDRGPVMAIDVEMKSGEKTTAYLNDSCFGYVVDILGIERSSATAKFIHLSDVAEVDFP